MKSNTDLTRAERLRKLGIRPFAVIIHDQPKEWLIKHFKTAPAQVLPTVLNYYLS